MCNSKISDEFVTVTDKRVRRKSQMFLQENFKNLLPDYRFFVAAIHEQTPEQFQTECQDIFCLNGFKNSPAGSMQNNRLPRAHLSRKSRKNHSFPGKIFSIWKNYLLRPRFLRFPGSGSAKFLYQILSAFKSADFHLNFLTKWL